MVILFFCIVILSCDNHKNKVNHTSTKSICNNLYVERYLPYIGGVFDGNTRSCYVTDSVNFRKFIGTYDDKERFRFSFDQDTIYAHKITYRNWANGDTIEIYKYSLKDLKKEGIME